MGWWKGAGWACEGEGRGDCTGVCAGVVRGVAYGVVFCELYADMSITATDSGLFTMLDDWLLTLCVGCGGEAMGYDATGFLAVTLLRTYSILCFLVCSALGKSGPLRFRVPPSPPAVCTASDPLDPAFTSTGREPLTALSRLGLEVVLDKSSRLLPRALAGLPRPFSWRLSVLS